MPPPKAMGEKHGVVWRPVATRRLALRHPLEHEETLHAVGPAGEHLSRGRAWGGR